MLAIWTTDRSGAAWVVDENGNHCSLKYWGDEALAEKALASNSDCSDCSFCSRCSDCSFKKSESAVLPEPIDIPSIPNIHKEVYEAASFSHDAFDMSTWHTCETTHCRAGWVVALAGIPGKKLESFFNTELAAMLIYRESGYEINPARFFDSNEASLADMKRLAEGA